MSGDKSTLNGADAEATGKGGQESSSGSSPEVSELPFKSDGEYKSTVEASEPPGEALKTDEETEEEGAEGPEGKEKPADGSEDLPPFHEHPRFKQLIEENQEFKRTVERLTGRLEELSASGARGGHAEEDLGFKDVTQLTPEERDEWRTEDPLGYEANLARQIRHETKSEILGELEQGRVGESIDRTFQTYAEENPDFMPMWQSGEIKAFMDANPGHNAMSAHMILTNSKKAETSKAEMDATIAAAVKEAEQNMLKKLKAKGHASVLGPGPAHSGKVKEEDPRMKEPKKFGGTTSVLAARLRERRSNS